ANRDAIALEAGVVRVPLRGHIVRIGARPATNRAEEVRFVRRAQRHPGGESLALVAEVIALAERGAEALLTIRLQEARGRRKGQLVGVAETVAADEAVLGEKLRIVEVGERGIEERDLVLVVIGHKDVEK